MFGYSKKRKNKKPTKKKKSEKKRPIKKIGLIEKLKLKIEYFFLG